MFERVKEIIEEQLNLDGVEITEASRFKEDLQADSLDLFELVMAFEDEYGVEIPSEDLEKITIVGSVIEIYESKRRRSIRGRYENETDTDSGNRDTDHPGWNGMGRRA